MDANTAIAFVIVGIIGGLVFVALWQMMRAAASDELDRRGIYPVDDPRYKGRK